VTYKTTIWVNKFQGSAFTSHDDKIINSTGLLLLKNCYLYT